MPLIVLPGPGNLVILGQRTLREVCEINVADQYHDLLRQVKGSVAESTSPPPLIVTQTRMHTNVEAFSGVGVGSVLDKESYEVTGELMVQGSRGSIATSSARS